MQERITGKIYGVCVCASVNLVVKLELEGAAKIGADAQCECVLRGNNRWNIDIS
jgi:hypothetical protein